jgi:hypothetical protein
LKLEFGPGDDDVRHRLLEMAHEDTKLFAVAPPAPDSEWVTTIWRMPLLTQEEYVNGAYSDLEHLLRERWDNFLKGPFRQLSETVRHQEWMRTDADNARQCQRPGCHKTLPPGSNKNRMYCSGACKQWVYDNRKS